MSDQSEFSRKSMLAAVGCWVGFLLGPNVMVAASNSNFMEALVNDYGASFSTISAALAIAPLTVAIMVPIAGRLMDRFGPRLVILPGIVVFGLSFLLLSRFQLIWQFAVLQILQSIGSAMNSSVGFAKVISSWFDKHRGFVLGSCVAFGAGLGQISMPKISQWLIDDYGWRGGYFGLSLMILCVSLPLVYLLARPNVTTIIASAHDEHTPAEIPGLTVKEAFRTVSFYKVFFAIMFGSMTLIGTLVHARTLLEEHGFTADIATTAMSLSFAGVLLGELSSGLLIDRFTTPRVVLPYFVCAWMGVIVFHSTSGSIPILLVGSLMMGMGLGGEIGQNAYLISRYCGLRSFATLYGFTFGASNVGIAIGIFMLGRIRDITGSYDPAVYVFGTTMLIAVLCIASLGPFVFKARQDH